MKKDVIRCSECEHYKEFTKLGNARSECYCNHPDGNYIHKYFREHHLQKMPGFLGFGKRWPHEAPLKTSPAWCPRKRQEN